MGPTLLAATLAITTPFTFAPIPISTPSTPPLLPDFTSVDFVNSVGSSALTVFSIMEALQVIGILFLIVIALRVLWWIYGLTTGMPASSEPLDVSGGLEAAADATGDSSFRKYGKAAKKISNFNPYRR